MFLAAGALLIFGAAFIVLRLHTSEVPPGLDLATTRDSSRGLFRVGYRPEPATIPLNQIHSWTLHVTTPDGAPVRDATITVDGDMPQHGHGLPTQPRVTGSLGDGGYLVEGMKFQMGGWWVVDLTVEAAGRRDSVRFNLILE